ncbi:dihydrolipoamide acetyltransferase family protein [Kitasatospora sp. NPDC001527]|uniref:dihydrolipoamide acetyltransferase family protein n=1 Tax=Kitasatospora sp. NPDC001527 TaxID=3154519 RepID=UPI003316B4E5
MTSRIREFVLPDVGEGLTDAQILQWHVSPGSPVHDGMVVCEVETAKAAVELPIPYDGVVHELRFPEGTTVDVGTVIITVDTGPGPEPAAPVAREPNLVGYGAAEPARRRPRPAPAAPAATAAPAAVPAPVSLPVSGPGPVSGPAAGPAPSALPLAKPPVRKLARDHGVDLAAVPPTGPDGVITREDVLAAARPAPAAPAPADGPQDRRIPVGGVRRATARAMVASAFTAPHATEFVTVDVTRTMRLVKALREDPELSGVRVNVLLLVCRALLAAIARHPEINASWDEDAQEIVQHGRINLGIAAATPRGLLVPNVKDAGRLTLRRLAEELDALVTTARAGRTTPAALAGGTVTITNIGTFGVDTGTPILNPGEAAILAFGAVRERPWVHKGKVRPRQVTTLALSFDHRLVDGELGSRVLADTARLLEDPRRLLARS